MPSRHLWLNLLPVAGLSVICAGARVWLAYAGGETQSWQAETTWSAFGFVLTIWFGLGLVCSGGAILFDAPGIYRKRRDGTLPGYIWLYLGGWLVIYRGLWLLKQRLSTWGLEWRKQDRAFDRIAPRLLLGRLLWELPTCQGEPEVDMVVDVTCEWSEPPALRGVRRYLAVPVVDTTRPTVEQSLRAAHLVVEHLQDQGSGAVYIHCANGYGRSAVVAAAVLLLSGTCLTAEDAIEMLVNARPVVSLRYRGTRPKTLCELMTQTELVYAIAEEVQRTSNNDNSTDETEGSTSETPLVTA